IRESLETRADRAVVETLERRAADALLDRVLPLVRAHGDLNAGNLIFDPAPPFALRGVIDWERSSPADLPLLDMFHILLAPDRIEGVGYGTAIERRLVPWRLPAHGRRLLERYISLLG